MRWHPEGVICTELGESPGLTSCKTSTIQVVSEVELLILLIVAVVTSAITAVVGAGGGLILLIVILQFVDPLVAVPVHAVIQLFANSTRAVTLRSEADWEVLRPYLAPVLPVTVAGYLLADGVPEDGGRAVIGVFALVAVWWPAATNWLAPSPGRGHRFALVGALNGLLQPTIGATGPLLSPAFKAATRDHPAFVATFAFAQVFNHSAKIVVFGLAGLAWSEHTGMMIVGIIGVVVGTRIGSQWMRRVDARLLNGLFAAAVTAGALRLLLGWVL